MTPYVLLQQRIIMWLRSLEQYSPRTLRTCVEILRRGEYQMSHDWVISLRMLGAGIPPYEKWYDEIDFPALVLEQIDSRTGAVLNVLGKKFVRDAFTQRNFGLEEWARRRGSGDNFLRTAYCAQPMALVKGDILATGERVLCEPREGGNGTVLIKLFDRNREVWLEVPSRISIGLLPYAYANRDEDFLNGS